MRADRRGLAEARWRLLLMIAEDDTLRRPQMLAEMSPLLPATAGARRHWLRVTLRIFVRAGLIVRTADGAWRTTRRGQALVAQRGGCDAGGSIALLPDDRDEGPDREPRAAAALRADRVGGGGA